MAGRPDVRSAGRPRAVFRGVHFRAAEWSCLTGPDTEVHGDQRALMFGKFADAAGGQGQKVVQLLAGKRPAFGGGLNFDELARCRS